MNSFVPLSVVPTTITEDQADVIGMPVAMYEKTIRIAAMFAPPSSAEADARTLAIKMLEEHAAHIKENAQALRNPDTEQEARARELAGLFLTDCAISLKMDKQLADVNEFLKRIAESDAAMKEPR